LAIAVLITRRLTLTALSGLVLPAPALAGSGVPRIAAGRVALGVCLAVIRFPGTEAVGAPLGSLVCAAARALAVTLLNIANGDVGCRFAGPLAITSTVLTRLGKLPVKVQLRLGDRLCVCHQSRRSIVPAVSVVSDVCNDRRLW